MVRPVSIASKQLANSETLPRSIKAEMDWETATKGEGNGIATARGGAILGHADSPREDTSLKCRCIFLFNLKELIKVQVFSSN